MQVGEVVIVLWFLFCCQINSDCASCDSVILFGYG